MFFHDLHGVTRVLIASVVGYLSLVTSLRIAGKRTLSKMSAFDLVVTIALGSCFGTMVLSAEVAILEGLSAFLALIAMQYLVAFATSRSASVRALVQAEPTLLFHDGSFCQTALRRERMTTHEVLFAVREQGFASLSEVASVVLEASGSLSVVRRPSDGTMSALQDVEMRS